MADAAAADRTPDPAAVQAAKPSPEAAEESAPAAASHAPPAAHPRHAATVSPFIDDDGPDATDARPPVMVNTPVWELENGLEVGRRRSGQAQLGLAAVN